MKKFIKWRFIMKYKISIIIPTYNIVKDKEDKNNFLKTIQSLEKQSIGFDNLEVLIVDDNSNEATKKLLKEINQEHENIKLILLDENSGSPSKPRMVGIKNAQADYIMFLDQDDTLTSYSCEVMLNVIDKKNADIVSSNYIIEMDEEYVAFNEAEKYKEFNPKHSLLKFQKQYAPWARIFRKEIINDIAFPNGILLEDSYLNFKAFVEAGKVIYLNDFYSYKYYVNYESITLNSKCSTISKGLKGIYEVICMLKKYPDNIPLVIDDLFSMVLQTLLMFNFSIRNNVMLLKEFKKLEDLIIRENENVSEIMKKPIWAKFLNFFITRKLFVIAALITKIIQLIIGNKIIKKHIFTKLFRHELYYEEKNNYENYLFGDNDLIEVV